VHRILLSSSAIIRGAYQRGPCVGQGALARARARGITARDEPIRRGRPPANTATERDIRKLTAKGIGILKFAKTPGIGTSAWCSACFFGTRAFAARIPQFDDVMPC